MSNVIRKLKCLLQIFEHSLITINTRKGLGALIKDSIRQRLHIKYTHV